MFYRVAGVLFILQCGVTAAHGVGVWGTDASAELVGSRDTSVGGGLDGTAGWGSGAFEISWTVSEAAGIWTYDYKITADAKALSHWIVETTDDGDPFNTEAGTSVFEGPKSGWFGEPSNPLMPNDIFGIKFDADQNGNEDLLMQTYTIVTDREPVYGTSYFKDGTDGGDDVVAWSSALNFADYQTNMTLTTTDFIVRPNGADGPPDTGTGPALPEPKAALLLIIAAGVLLCSRRGRLGGGGA